MYIRVYCHTYEINSGTAAAAAIEIRIENDTINLFIPELDKATTIQAVSSIRSVWYSFYVIDCLPGNVLLKESRNQIKQLIRLWAWRV